VTSPEQPPSVRPVEYRGEPLDAARGPGLGCFRFQLVVLAVLIVLTPLAVIWDAPIWLSGGLLFVTIVLLLFAGQTVIFLLRLVAADRREGRRRPLDSSSPTVGELEDLAVPPDRGPEAPAADRAVPDEPGSGEPAVQE
jgi:hypothetical protein